jgi:hypothetical protein
MPRQAREKSETGIYHLMLRGINKQNIFEDEEDKSDFKSEVVETDTYFLMVLRYIHQNLLKAGITRDISKLFVEQLSGLCRDSRYY